ncbi:DUF1642 domain-containing protein [Weissella kandleri]|uniref:DUF1642 domain-containing protein n=1 Tax=Weissella kandleri TaxID=1616 RepID=UPI00387E7BF7
MTDKYKVPQAVADYISYEKEEGYTLFGAFTHLEQIALRRNNGVSVPASVYNVYEWVIDGNQENFAKAWIYGFEVKTPTWVIINKHDYDEPSWLVLKLSDNGLTEYWHTEEWTLRKTAIAYATRITDPKLKDALLYAYKDFDAIEVEE